MALKAYLTDDEHSKLDEAQKGLYAKDAEGRHLLQVEGRDGFALENVQGLKSTVEALRSESNTLKGKLKGFGELTPEQAAEALRKATEYDAIDPKAEAGKLKEQYETRTREALAAAGKEWEARVKAAEERVQAQSQQLNRLLIETAVTTTTSDPSIKGKAHMLLPAIREITRVVEDNGTARVSVLNPETGVERVGAQGKPLTIPELLLEMRADERWKGAFEIAGPAGGGGAPAGGAPGGTGGKKVSEMSVEEKAAFVHTQGKAAFEALPQ